ncbi:hypothetical protein DEU56DRAFT_789793, partial [Suillus clintonianus]|uniref:uncharacterized protein n=1 Tax=Suillus clintonianus TaxID=1904413 RepID=UPI001B883148
TFPATRFVLLFHFCRMLPVCATGTYNSELIGSVLGVEELLQILIAALVPVCVLLDELTCHADVRVSDSASDLINSTTDSPSEEVPNLGIRGRARVEA